MKEHPKAHLFYRSYANIPLRLREEIVACVDGEPMTFQVIKLELDNKTEAGYEALDQMIRLKIL